MHQVILRLGAAVLLTAALSFAPALACTSFMLETDQGLYYAHSLNQGSVPVVPGMVFINQRQVWKEGYSWAGLIDAHSESAPELVWKSRYGSVTFNLFGKNLPDGGVNEAGLFIWEMGFDTQYPDDPDNPTLFQTQWMQYVLDNFETVDEVIANAHRMNLDGWGWHYFVADSSGGTAIIDFVDGHPIVHTGEAMPIPLCCNSFYPEAMNWLKQYQGFGGELEIKKVHEEIPRFIYGAKLLKEYESADRDPVEYCFNTLDEMSPNVRWAVVYDLNKQTAYFKTNIDQSIRSFSVATGDFGSEFGTQVLDIDEPGPGDVKDRFAPYSTELNAGAIHEVFGLLCDMAPFFRNMLLDDQGITLERLVEVVNGRSNHTIVPARMRLEGRWPGMAISSSEDDSTAHPITLVFERDGVGLTGSIIKGDASAATPMSNLTYQAGLISFVVEGNVEGNLRRYELHFNGDEIRGGTVTMDGNSESVRLRRP